MVIHWRGARQGNVAGLTVGCGLPHLPLQPRYCAGSRTILSAPRRVRLAAPPFGAASRTLLGSFFQFGEIDWPRTIAITGALPCGLVAISINPAGKAGVRPTMRA